MRDASRTISYPLYLAGLGTVFCGVAALGSTASEQSSMTLVSLLLAGGYGFSILLRTLGYTARLIELAVVAAALALYVQIVSGRGVVDLIVPLPALGSPELKLATMLLWLEVLRSFTLVSDESVVFSAVPSVVLISLAATSNLNPEIMAFFIMYLVLAAFLLAHRPVRAASGLRRMFRVALGVSVLALVIGSVVAIPVRTACTTAFAAAMPEFTRIRERYMPSGLADADYLRIAQGPIHLSDETVMIVRAHMVGSMKPMGAYWRSRVFDNYTGHGWQTSAEYVRVLSTRQVGLAWHGRKMYEFGSSRSVNAGRTAIREGRAGLGSPARGGSRLIEQKFRVLPMRGTALYAASRPVVVRAPYKKLERNEFGCWQGAYRHMGVAEYSVISELPVGDPRRLRRAGANYPSEVRDRFLTTVTGSARAGDLARRITAGLPTPYDRVVAIQHYLGKNYTYDLKAPPAPPGADAVDYFLFSSRTGYCDVFASAMVMMCREVDIPARLAAGFLPGVYNPDEQSFRVRDMDRHVWPEVYFPGCGWVTFDPTELTHNQHQGWVERFGNRVRRVVGSLVGGPTALPTAIVLLAVFTVLAFGSELRGIRFSRGRARVGRLERSAVAQHLAIRRLLGAVGHHLTPLEAASTGKLESAEARRIALEAADLFNEVRYSPRPVCLADVRELHRLRRELRAAIRAAGRRGTGRAIEDERLRDDGR